jgi:TetR/AcrR family transcriptional regulator
MNQFYDKVELALKQALRLAVTQGHGQEADVPRAPACWSAM